ncbi:MAG: amidase family protein, partial [Chthoniobacterales bacterium]
MVSCAARGCRNVSVAKEQKHFAAAFSRPRHRRRNLGERKFRRHARSETTARGQTENLAEDRIAIKDVINVEGEACGCASKILTGYKAPYDATVIKK